MKSNTMMIQIPLAAVMSAALLLLGACGGGAAQVQAGAPATVQTPCADCGKAACPGCGEKSAAKKDCAGKKDCDDCEGEVAFKMMPAADVAKSLSAGGNLHVYDVNSVERFNKGHVKGATYLNRHLLGVDSLPADKAAQVVFYCGSSRCKASHKAAKKAMSLGYTNVAVMPEGIKGWEEARLPTETATLVDPIKLIDPAGLNMKRQAAAQIYIFDVNSAERFATSHVAGAVNVTTKVATDHLPPNKNAMLVFYCASPRCGASHKAAHAAAGHGYTNVWVMGAGIKGWEEANLPVEKAGM